MKLFGLVVALVGLYAMVYWAKLFKAPENYRTHIGPWGESLYAGGSKEERLKTAKWIAACSFLTGGLAVLIGVSIWFLF